MKSCRRQEQGKRSEVRKNLEAREGASSKYCNVLISERDGEPAKFHRWEFLKNLALASQPALKPIDVLPMASLVHLCSHCRVPVKIPPGNVSLDKSAGYPCLVRWTFKWQAQ